jgi:CubicO group peptidase (beta-lactamase class C family)
MLRSRVTTTACVFLLPVIVAVCVPESAAAPSTLSDSPDTLAAFFDPIITKEIGAGHVPGAVVCVVHGGKAPFSKGYGSASLEADIPIDPETTLFRVGSISKLVTATAVMQLVEQRRLDLNADVNQYLKDFQLPRTYKDPVTLAHLLTHTAGFDDRFLGMAARTAADLVPLGVYLARRMPPRVMPPGAAISYSNHGYALAGYIVETATGRSFRDYVQENIFNPLGMDHSHFTLIPDPGAPFAVGYTYYFRKHHRAPDDYPFTVPASSLTTTANDMARFMIAHLQDGRFQDTRILGEDTARFMHERHFTHHPDWTGWTYGFAEHFTHGRRTLEHTGLIWGFATLVMLLPDDDAGLFVSSTTDDGRLYSVVRARFLDAYFPHEEDPPPPAVPAGATDRIDRVSGYYRNNRYCRTTFLKFSVMIPRFVPEIHIRRGRDDGVLLLSYAGWRPKPQQLVEVEPYCFQGFYVAGADPAKRRLAEGPRVAFRLDDSGRVTDLFNGNSAYERIPRYETWGVQVVAVVVSLILCAYASLAWPIAAGRRRRRNAPALHPGVRATLWFATAASALNFLFAIAFTVFILAMNPPDIGYGPPPVLVGILVIPVISGIMTLLLAPWSIAARKYLPRPCRLHLAVTTVASVLFLTLLAYWNLLGFQF